MEEPRPMRQESPARQSFPRRGRPNPLVLRRGRPNPLLRLLAPLLSVPVIASLSLGIASGLLAGCKDDGEPYQPVVPPTGAKANLPPVPSVPKKPLKEGEAYTVWGASYY